jgi:hypothetical protein
MPLSLVSYYGDKPPALRDLILALQEQLSKHLGSAFRPYAMEQVHATIMGMETEVENGAIYSKWYMENRGITVPVDLAGLTSYLQSRLPPIKIRIGGYQPEQDHGFISRGQHPYERSFSIQGSTAVAMGWPVEPAGVGLRYTTDLYALRTAFETYHLCHKWNKDGYRDNDFFFVLGKIDQDLADQQHVEAAAAAVRQLMAEREQIITLNADTLSLVAYVDTELPLHSSRVFPIQNARLAFDHLLYEK